MLLRQLGALIILATAPAFVPPSNLSPPSHCFFLKCQFIALAHVLHWGVFFLTYNRVSHPQHC